MSGKLTTTDGMQLPLTVEAYDSQRTLQVDQRLASACYAPLTTIDFDAIGDIRICNHSRTTVANIRQVASILSVWRGSEYERYRRQLTGHCFDAVNCEPCIRQILSGVKPFAVEHFDWPTGDELQPDYPMKLLFRLGSTCNLACVMCDGIASSRIRRERDRLPLAISPYGDAFFEELREIIPHAKHIEFYGGEPLLVPAHQRIFDIMDDVKATCQVYINTNGTILTPRVLQLLETYTFSTLAVSMDAVSDKVHGLVRKGVKQPLFLDNLLTIHEIAQRRKFPLILNVTEHRKNWFELPEIFRFAETHGLWIHINVCTRPHNVTLYTLPTVELMYVDSFLRAAKIELEQTFPDFHLRVPYDRLLVLTGSEIARRTPDWQPPPMTDRNVECDGMLATPWPGIAPFATEPAMLFEISRMKELPAPTAVRMLHELRTRLWDMPTSWSAATAECDVYLKNYEANHAKY